MTLEKVEVRLSVVRGQQMEVERKEREGSVFFANSAIKGHR